MKTTICLLTFICSAAPVDLPEPGMTFQNGDLMKVSGWGALSSNGQHSEELRMVTVPFVSDAGSDKRFPRTFQKYAI